MKRLDEMFDRMKDGVRAVAGQAKEVAGKVWDGAEHPVAQGAQELASALLGKQDGFVLYPRQGFEQGKDVQQPEVQNLPTKESGHEMEM